MSEPNYCPICAHQLASRVEGGRLRPACDNCGYVYYHNPVPGVGLIIEMDGGVVFVQRGQPPQVGRWALPSGFVEADESAEEAAIREAEEETNLKVEIIELIGVNSFPEGPPVSGIMIFFRARPLSGELRAGDDASDVRVFQSHEMPRVPFRTHREVLAKWLASQETAVPLRSMPAPPSADFTIRPAEPRDWDDVCGLMQLIPANRHLPDDEWQQIRWRYRESAGVEVFVAASRQQEQSLIIGFIALSVVRTLVEGYGLINDMAVLPTYQRQGIGADLLDVAIRRAGQLNLGSLMVNTERANDQVRAFYAALGFAEGRIMRFKLR